MMHTALLIENEKGNNELIMVELYHARDRSENYQSGDKLVRLDSEGSNKYVVATGFHQVRNNWFVVTSDGEIIQEKKFRRPNSMEFDRFSRYPDTVALRTYLNDTYWGKLLAEPVKVDHRERKKRKALEAIDPHRRHKNTVYNAVGDPVEEDEPKEKIERGVGPHLHVDDFMSRYGGSINFSHGNRATRSFYVGEMNYGSHIDINFRGGRVGFQPVKFEDNHYRWYDHPYSNHRPMCGSRLTGTFLLEREKFDHDRFFHGWYDERDPVYVKLNEDHEKWNEFWCPLKLWDPVSEIVRVERICGNDTFISEFGYICSIKMYTLITGEEYSRWRLKGMV